jgi:thiol-disulfide isomerase/thioredoxin
MTSLLCALLLLSPSSPAQEAATARAEAPPMPELELRYRRGFAPTWRLFPPAGEHLAEGTDLLLDLWFMKPQPGDPSPMSIRTRHTAPAHELIEGWPMNSLYFGQDMHGSMSVSLCSDDGGQCRPVHMAIDLELDKRRGRLRWIPEPAPPPSPDVAPSLALDEALAAAAQDGKPLLLDFSAQWCPPCQTLAAEVLHARGYGEILAGVHLVVLDADDPSSWATKDRYGVGGYPTVIVTDAAGEELARLVGYPGEASFLAWLEGATDRGDSLAYRLESLRADLLEPAEAAVLALDLVQARRHDEAREALARADDSEPAQRVRLALDDDPDALRWLLDHGLEDLRSWLWDGLDALRADPALAAEIQPRLAEAARGAEPAQASEIMALLAELAPDEEAPTLYAAAAEALRTTLSDEPVHNRGHWSELAWLLEQAGDPEGALAVLDEALSHFPQEFGYRNSKARLLQAQGLLPQARAEAQRALLYAHGDQRLRAVTQLAGLELELGSIQEGLDAIDAVLADFPVPDDELDVRTHRYLDQLEAVREELQRAGVETTPAGQ